MKQHIQEALSNLKDMIDVDAVTTPVTAQLKQDMKKKYDAFKDMTETDDNYLGAKKQPVPKKVEIPKAELSESLFEDASLEQELSDFLSKKGYDVTSDDAKNYIASVAEYISDNRDYTGEDYSIEDWYADTQMNCPEDLEMFLVKMPSISDLTKVKDVDEDVSIFVDEYNNVYYIVYETNQTILDGGFKSAEEAMNLYIEYMGNESLKEAFDINSISRSKLIDAIDEFYREDFSNHYIIDNKTIEDILTENGASEDDSDPYEGFYSSMSNEQIKNVFQIVRDYLKTRDEDEYDSDIYRMFKLKRAWVDESLKEDYSEDELEQAINVIKKYYHNDLHSFLEAFVFNSPIADGDEIIKELADYMSDDDYYDESLTEKSTQISKEKAEEGDLWTTVYNELSGEPSFFKKSLGSRDSKYDYKIRRKYPKYEVLPTDDGVRVYGDSEEDLDFAKQVATDYSLNYDVNEVNQFYIDIEIPEE